MTLKTPSCISFEQVDESLAVGYVRYRRLPPGSQPRTESISSDVNVDFDEQGNVLGIEIIGVDVESIATAAGFAKGRGLDFPSEFGQ
jgi:uncharacterized protein YuzE